MLHPKVHPDSLNKVGNIFKKCIMKRYSDILKLVWTQLNLNTILGNLPDSTVKKQVFFDFILPVQKGTKGNFGGFKMYLSLGLNWDLGFLNFICFLHMHQTEAIDNLTLSGGFMHFSYWYL